MNFTKFLLLKYKSFSLFFSLILIILLFTFLIILPYNSNLLKCSIIFLVIISYFIYILYSFINYNIIENSNLIEATLNSDPKYCPNKKNKLSMYLIYASIMLGWTIGLFILTIKKNPKIWQVSNNFHLDQEYNILMVVLSSPFLVLLYYVSSSLTNIGQSNLSLEKLSQRYKINLTSSKNITNIGIGILVIVLVLIIGLKVELGKEYPAIIGLLLKGSIALILFLLYTFYYFNYNNNFIVRNYYNILNNRRYNFGSNDKREDGSNNCSTSQFGCCDDGFVSKIDQAGTNCPSNLSNK